MYINNIKTDYNNISKKEVSSKGGRGIIKTLSNPDSLASVISLECFVTGGRSKKAYERGGFPEFRERLTDDLTAAIFWMKGVDIFNKIGDKIGKKILKLPDVEFDVGKDALRTPFENVIANLNLNATEAKAMEKKLAAFKFTKILSSSVLAIGFVGFVLPKVNHFITEMLMKKNNQKSENSPQSPNVSDKYKLLKECSFESFEEQINKNKTQSFKGGGAAEIMTTAAHYLENNQICKLLTCDVGILTGRMKTARNKDEGLEYLFRDTSSSFFYYASTPLIYKLLQKITGSTKYTEIDPVAAKQLNELFKEQLKKADNTYTSMNVKDFADKTIGFLDDKSKELIAKLPFKSDVISLNELKKYVTDENIITKAGKMAELQPSQAAAGKVLTRQQVEDVFKNGSINTPEFMKKIYNEKFTQKALTNDYKYIPMKKITKFRSDIDKYAQSVIDAAKKKNNGIVDEKLLNSVNKKSFAMSAGFRIFALAVSAFALGYVIPTLQCAITKKRTGKDEAPGLRQYEENKKQN